MSAKVLRKVGKFKFLRFPNQGIRRNKKIRKLATDGKLTYSYLENFISSERDLGYPIKYSKPIGFKKRK